MALGLDGMPGMVAASTADGTRTLGVGLEQRVGLLTLGPRTCAVRQAWETWDQQHGALPLMLETPGRTRQESPRRWHGHRVVRPVDVEDADGRLAGEDRRLLGVPSSQWAEQAAGASTAAQAPEAARVAEHVERVAARWCA